MKPSQNSLLKADTYVRSVAKGRILGLVHELFSPDIEGSRSDTFPAAEVTEGYLPPESFQDDMDLLVGGVLPAGCGPDLSNEGPGLLGTSLSTPVCVALGHVGSFLDVDTLYPASGAITTLLLSGFIPSNCVPLSLTFYTGVDERNVANVRLIRQEEE
jgi:hypothetical protein